MKARIYEHLLYRHWNGWWMAPEAIYSLCRPAEAQRAITLALICLAPFDLGDPDAIAFSPDTASCASPQIRCGAASAQTVISYRAGGWRAATKRSQQIQRTSGPPHIHLTENGSRIARRRIPVGKAIAGD